MSGAPAGAPPRVAARGTAGQASRAGGVVVCGAPMRPLLATALATAALALGAGCMTRAAHGEPTDERTRRQEEFAACWKGTFPRWLDDDALAEASRADRWRMLGTNPDDSFRASTVAYSSVPPPPRAADSGGSSRAAALLEERKQFQSRCALLRTSGRGPAVPAPR